MSRVQAVGHDAWCTLTFPKASILWSTHLQWQMTIITRCTTFLCASLIFSLLMRRVKASQEGRKNLTCHSGDVDVDFIRTRFRKRHVSSQWVSQESLFWLIKPSYIMILNVNSQYKSTDEQKYAGQWERPSRVGRERFGMRQDVSQNLVWFGKYEAYSESRLFWQVVPDLFSLHCVYCLEYKVIYCFKFGAC